MSYTKKCLFCGKNKHIDPIKPYCSTKCKQSDPEAAHHTKAYKKWWEEEGEKEADRKAWFWLGCSFVLFVPIAHIMGRVFHLMTNGLW